MNSKPPRHSYLRGRQAGAAKTLAQKEAQLEQALIDVANATDGNGNAVRLISYPLGPPTAQQLKEETFRFMENFDIDAMYIKPDASGKLVESADVETAVWANLALLARATAAAIRLEAARTNG